MKKLFSLFITCLCLFSCMKSERITKEEVVEALNRFDEGWKFKRPAVIDSILSPSYLYFTQSGGTFSRNNVVATAGSNQYKIDTVYRRQFEIKLDGNTATVNSTWLGKGSYYGKPFDDFQRCSVTLVKLRGKVKILSEHCTPINR